MFLKDNSKISFNQSDNLHIPFNFLKSSIIREVTPVNIISGCDYQVVRQDGNETFYDVILSKFENDSGCYVQVNATFNQQSINDYVTSLIDQCPKGDLDCALDKFKILQYEPPTQIKLEINGQVRDDKISAEIIPVPDFTQTFRYSLVIDPRVDEMIKIGENSIVITQKINSFAIDYITNATIEPNNVSHLQISSNSPYDSLVGYWNFDADGINTTSYDMSGNNLDGTYAGLMLNSSSLYNDGVSGSSDNAGAGITLPTTTLLDFNSSSVFTVSTWVNPRSTGCANQNCIYFGRWNTVGGISAGMQIGTASSNRVILVIQNSSNTAQQIVTSNNVLNGLGNWSHIVVVWNTTNNVSIYTNGTLVFDGNFSITTLNHSIEPWNIGFNDRSTTVYNGSVDEVMVFNTTLNSSQISDIFNNQSKRFHTFGYISTNGTINISERNNRLNVSLNNLENIFSTNISLAISYYNNTNWLITQRQNITQTNFNYTYILTGGTNNITINWTLTSSASTQFYTPFLMGDIILDFYNVTEESPPQNSCTYSSGNWNVNCWDNCSITSNVNLNDNNLTVNGSGTFTVQANISNIDRYNNYNACHVIKKNGGSIFK